MRWLLLITALLVLLIWLHPVRQNPSLDWLAGSWHDPQNQATRLIFTKPCQHGVTGLLLLGQDTTVLAIEPDGHLTMRVLGRNLSRNNQPQQFTPLEQGPQQLRYSQLGLHYFNARTEGCELELQFQGQTLRLQPD